MPRRSRIHYDKALYHVMHQGNYKQNIFLHKDDYHFVYRLLKRVVENYGCKIHLFCLMTNHIHLVIEVSYAPLSKIMQSFSSSYSRHINKKMDRHGHLFRGRYLCKIIQDERYLLELCYYIHNNPVAANMVKSLDDYPWSSHHCYLKQEKLTWVTTKHVLSFLKRNISDQAPYRSFMQDKGSFYAEPKFCEFSEIGELVILDSVNEYISTTAKIDLSMLSIKLIAHQVCGDLDVSLADIFSVSHLQRVVLARVLIAYFAHYYGGYTILQIATFLCVRPDSLSRSIRRQFCNVEKKKNIEKRIKCLKSKFLSLSLKY